MKKVLEYICPVFFTPESATEFLICNAVQYWIAEVSLFSWRNCKLSNAGEISRARINYKQLNNMVA